MSVEARDDEATAPDPGLQSTRAQASPTRSTPGGAGAPAASERIGRYLAIEELGRGGMGRVLRAYDTKLQREVALKVLVTDRLDARARARMIREARTMAKLNHPHVVAVYDVEDEPPHGVILAMELVAGSTLSQWLAERRRAWDEILAAFVEAGRGLEAAHVEGLLHRDFKPANVLVALGPAEGLRGAVKVTDFGLAKETRDDTTVQSDDPEDPTDHEVTEAGVVMGTPAYMAPEQHRGQALTDAADQFAFCVSLWEALHGERPFGGTTREELRANVLAGKRRPAPAGSIVPGWLQRACERGLAVQPEQRWPSMNVLLAELGQGRTRARRRTAVAAAGVLVVLAGGGEAYRHWAIARAVEACEATGDELVFGPEQARAVHDALLATGAGHASTTAAKLMPWLDGQAAAWREARTGACLDAEVHGRWSRETLERSLWCLDERRTELESLVHELSQADVGVVNKAVPAAAGLASVAPCRDPSALERVGLPPAETREAVRAVRADVTRAGNLERAGRYPQALALGRDALARAQDLGWRPITAAARARVGRLLEQTAAYADAEVALEDAFFEATDGVAPEVEIEAAAELVYLVSEKLARHGDAARWGRHAEAALARIAEGEGLGRARLLRGRANVAYHTGELDEAKATGERLVALQEALLGSAHPDLATSLNNLAGAHFAAGELDEAKRLCERALAIREQALGPDHPDVAMSLGNLANLHRALGEHAQAKALFGRAIAIDEAALGPTHPDVASALVNLGTLQYELGEHAEAQALFERSLAITEEAMGPEHPQVAVGLNNLAYVRTAMGDHAAATVMLERSLAILEKTLGPEHADLVNGLVNLADAHMGLGEATHAEALLERAVAIAEESGGSPVHLAGLRATLAKARWDAASDGDPERARAVSLAEGARATLRAAGSTKELAAVEAWLASHAAAP